MKVILDERETALYEKCQAWKSAQSTASYVELSKEVLPLGDILFKTDEDKDVLLIERKSFSDLLSSVKDGRYEEQSYRLLHSGGFPPHSIIYVLEGMFSQLNRESDKKVIYSAMTSLNYFKGFSVHRTSSLAETAQWIMLMADKIEREFLKGNPPYYLKSSYLRTCGSAVAPISTDTNVLESSEGNIIIDSVDDSTLDLSTPPITGGNYCTVVKKVKKDNVTPENIGEIILCQIPGISSITAMAIMKRFITFPNLIQELQKDSMCIENLTVETNGKSRKISKSSLENIRRFLLSAN